MLIARAAESSRPTHASPQCLSACAYFAVVLAGLLHGLPTRGGPRSGVACRLSGLGSVHALHPEIEEVAEGSFRTKAPPEIRGAGLRGAVA